VLCFITGTVLCQDDEPPQGFVSLTPISHITVYEVNLIFSIIIEYLFYHQNIFDAYFLLTRSTQERQETFKEFYWLSVHIVTWYWFEMFLCIWSPCGRGTLSIVSCQCTYCCPETIHGEITRHYSRCCIVAFCYVHKCELSYMCPGRDIKWHPHRLKLYQIGCMGSGLVLVKALA